MALLPLLLLLAVVVTVRCRRRWPPAARRPAGRRRWPPRAPARAAHGGRRRAAGRSRPPSTSARPRAGQRRAGRARRHRPARTDHLRHRAHRRPGRRRAHLAPAAGRGAARPARAPRSCWTPPAAGWCGRPAAAVAGRRGHARRRRAAGRPDGRRVTHSRPTVRARGASPFPGSFYGAPAAAGPARPGRARRAVVLWIVADRPPWPPRTTGSRRRSGAPRPTGCCGVGGGVPLVVAGGLLRRRQCPHSVASSAGWRRRGAPAWRCVRGRGRMLAGVVVLLPAGARRPGRRARRPAAA